MQPFDLSSQWLAAALSPEALIASLSSGMEQVTGYSAQELVGKPVTKILADHSAFEMPRILKTARELGFWEGDVIHRTRGGKPLEARCSISLLAGKENRPDGFLLVSNVNKCLAVSECEDPAVLEIATKLRAFAHDLNNPLAVIMGFTQLLILNPGCQGQIRSDIEKVYSEIKRVTQVVEKLHEYAHFLYGNSKSNQAANSTAQQA